MSKITNGEGYPVHETSNSRPVVQPEIWPPHYPSLVYLQHHEGSLIHPVLPTAPNYPITPISEHVPYPQLSTTQATPEYYSQSIPSTTFRKEISPQINNDQSIPKRTYDAGKQAPIDSVDHIVDVTPAIEEPIANQSTQDRREKLTTKYCSKICWIVGAYLILTLITFAVFYQYFLRTIEDERDYHSRYHNRCYD